MAILPQCLWGQQIEYPASLVQLLDQVGLEVLAPLDASYRDFEPLENEYLNCPFAIRSRGEHLEIRYYVLPWNDADPTTTNPHIASFRAVSSIATNSDEALISVLELDKTTLLRDFNADWGIMYFFQPKTGFSEEPICKMLSLCKEGQGTVFVFYLFEDPGNEALDRREMAVRFR